MYLFEGPETAASSWGPLQDNAKRLSITSNITCYRSRSLFRTCSYLKICWVQFIICQSVRSKTERSTTQMQFCSTQICYVMYLRMNVMYAMSYKVVSCTACNVGTLFRCTRISLFQGGT